MKKIFLILFFCSLLFSSFTSQSIQKLPKPGEELPVYLARVDLPKKTKLPGLGDPLPSDDFCLN